MPEIKQPKKRKDMLQRLDESVRALQRRFDEFFEAPTRFRSRMRTLWDGDSCCLEALGDVQETETEYIVTLDLPMVNKEDIEITVTDEALSVQARMRQEVHYERWGTAQREIRFQSLSKQVALPQDADSEKVQAAFKEGLLEIRVPKKKQPRKVPID